MPKAGRPHASVFAALAVAAMATLLAPPVLAGNRVTIPPEPGASITITVPIDALFGSPELAARWGPAITRYWNPRGQGWRWCGREVIVTTRIRPIPSMDQRIEGNHLVIVVGPQPGGQHTPPPSSVPEDPRSEVGSASWPEQGSMSDQDYDTLIGSRAGEDFLGVGVIFEGDSPIRNIVRAHGIDQVIDCRLRARHEAEWTSDGAVTGGVRHDHRLAVAFEIDLQEIGGGQLRGRAEGSARLKGTSTARQCITDDAGGREYSFEVTGTRRGDQVEVRLPGGLEISHTVTPTECPARQPYRGSFPIPYLETLKGVLADGWFKETTPRASHPIGRVPGGIVYTVEIEEREVRRRR